MENVRESKLQVVDDNLYQNMTVFDILRIFSTDRIKEAKYSTIYKCQRSSAKASATGKAETQTALVLKK